MQDLNIPESRLKTSSKRNTILIIFGLVLTAVVSGLVVYFWQQMHFNKLQTADYQINDSLKEQMSQKLGQNDQEFGNTQVTTIPVSSDNAKLNLQDQPDSSKTQYTDELNKFEISFPVSWVVSDIQEDDAVFKVESFFTNEVGESDGARFKVYVFKNVTDDVQQWIDKNYPINSDVETLISSMEINIGGEQGIYREKTSGIAGGNYDDAAVKHNGTIYYFSTMVRVLGTHEVENLQFKQDLQNILSGFKFIN